MSSTHPQLRGQIFQLSLYENERFSLLAVKQWNPNQAVSPWGRLWIRHPVGGTGEQIKHPQCPVSRPVGSVTTSALQVIIRTSRSHQPYRWSSEHLDHSFCRRSFQSPLISFVWVKHGYILFPNIAFPNTSIIPLPNTAIIPLPNTAFNPSRTWL